MLKKVSSILFRFNRFFSKRSEKAYINWLRKQGVKIGDGCSVKNPRRILIDTTRPSLLEIGSHVFLHENMSILTHDWTGWTLLHLYGELIPSHKRVKIGNNVWFGEGVKVLSGVEIGDNCIIGAYSIVTRSIPANSVAVGNPCRIICSIDDFYKKRKNCYQEEIEDFARSIKERFNRTPTLNDFYDDYVIFVDGSNYKEYDFPYNTIFNEETLNKWKRVHHRKYKNYEDFLSKILS